MHFFFAFLRAGRGDGGGSGRAVDSINFRCGSRTLWFFYLSALTLFNLRLDLIAVDLMTKKGLYSNICSIFDLFNSESQDLSVLIVYHLFETR